MYKLPLSWSCKGKMLLAPAKYFVPRQISMTINWNSIKVTLKYHHISNLPMMEDPAIRHTLVSNNYFENNGLC